MNVLREEITFQHFRLSRSAFPLCGMRGEKATARRRWRHQNDDNDDDDNNDDDDDNNDDDDDDDDNAVTET